MSTSVYDQEGKDLTYTENPAFLLFLDLLSKEEREDNKINDASERKWKGLKKKASE